MRIAFDGRSFHARAGGVRRYVTELVAGLRAVDPAIDLVAIGAEEVPAGVAHRPASFSLPTNLGWCATGLPLAAARERFDVFHAPAYTAPLWGARPLVVTLHDVSYARHPEWSPHPQGIGAVRAWFYRRSARRADRIITDSSFSKREIIAAYGIDERRIDVIPLGVGRAFVPDPARPREPMVLHVGDIHVRRNLDVVLAAVLNLSREVPSLRDLRLVLVGNDLGALAALRTRADQAGARDRLVAPGRVDDATLVEWYQRASVLAYPSRYEGFGLPLLEAMACGTPVIASSAASVPEVTGDAAVLLSPDDADGWRAALHRVLTDPAHARDLSARGQARAAAFSWTRTAELTLETYGRASV